MDELATHLDQVAARPLYERLQELLHRDQPVTYLYEPMRLVGARRTLRNVDPNSISAYFHLRDWTLDEAPGTP
jgi:peptide/nickel transport system substrate-binding protein